VDYRKRRAKRPHSHQQGCSGTDWELQVPRCPHRYGPITVQTDQHSREEWTITSLPPQEAEKILHGPSDPQKGLQLYHWDYQLAHHNLVWQLLGFRPQGATESSTYGPLHHWDRTSCHPGTLYQAVSEEGFKNCQTPATRVIAYSLCYYMANLLGPKSSWTASTPKP
jgi:hypothetical protein